MPTRAIAPASLDSAIAQLRVTIDTASVRLPLAVNGSNICFADVDRALQLSIENAALSVKRELLTRNASPYELYVEIIEANVDYSAGLLTVQLTTRVTLREKPGNTYVAQTHAHATASGSILAHRGSDVVLRCIDTIGAQLSDWLGGITLPKTYAFLPTINSTVP